MLRSTCRAWAVAIVAVSLVTACEDAPVRLNGFSPESAQKQVALERRLMGAPNGLRMQDHHRALTDQPHHAGTAANAAYAEYISAQLLEFGFDSIETHRYEVLLPYPVERSLSLVAPGFTPLTLDEPPLAADADTQIEGVLPTFNAYSADGDVTAEVVYVNYGLPDDYRVLDSLGVSVEGRIVLARYGNSWRGIKPRLAAERGAVGALLFSDPADDGFVRGAVLPEGIWRPADGVQRGSALDLPLYPGDPTTPFYASTASAERLPLDSLPTVQTIPVQPISHAAAEPILKALRGIAPPESWVGGLPVDYTIGPGPATVHLKLRFDWSVRPIVNVIGLLLGEEIPEQWVMAGGHRDAWTFGGRDPMSGAVSLLESARIIGAQVRRGHRPRRTIAIASWDAEEWGMIGSTEWGEEFAADLPGRVVTYLNRESYHVGPFSAGGSHALQPLVNEITRRIDAPRERQSVYDAWRQNVQATTLASSTSPLVDHGGWTDVRLKALGSGSDYTVFLDHLGIPSINFGFDTPTGVYHSLYDTHEYFKRWGDPGWNTGEQLAEIVALFLTRIANAEVPPFDHTATAETIDRYLDELESEIGARGLRVRLRAVRDANESFALNAAAVNAAIDGVLALPPVAREERSALVAHLGKVVIDVERRLLTPEGLPGRPWYRHQLYAPGVTTGYGAKTLPGLREAIEAGDSGLAQEMADKLEASLLNIVESFRQVLEEARVEP